MNQQKAYTKINPKWIVKEKSDILDELTQQLQEYFTKKRKKITLEYTLDGTAFQKEVWNQLQNIPYGSTTNYKTFAKSIASSEQTRAVAGTLAKNPLLFILPCHRVIGSNQTLKGYAAGVHIKKKLLDLEKSDNLTSC